MSSKRRLVRLRSALLFILCATVPCSAAADPVGAPAHSLAELREMQQSVETRHSQKLQDIQNALAIQSYDSDTAIMLRMKAEQEYKSQMEQLRLEQQAAYNAMDSKQRAASDATGSRTPSTNAAIPHFQSQSVITYPQGEGAAPTEEKPVREGQQKNVGFGTRELQF
jgi:hypothetical protein